MRIYNSLLLFCIFYGVFCESKCHDDLSIAAHTTTRNLLSTIGCSDYDHVYTVDHHGILEKRDSRSLNVLRYRNTGLSSIVMLCTENYIVLSDNNGRYMQTYDRKYLNIISKNSFSNFGSVVGYRNYIVGTKLNGAHYNTIVYIDAKTLSVVEEVTLNVRNIDKLITYKEDLFAVTDSISNLYLVRDNIIELYERLSVNTLNIHMSDGGKIYWLEGGNTLQVQNKTYGNFNINLANLPFEYSYLQVNNFMKSGHGKIFISMRSSSYGTTDHNYIIVGSARTPGSYYDYSHCTFHDQTGGVKGIEVSYDNNIYIFDNLEGYSEIYSILV